MCNSPLVSVITPVYNHANYLGDYFAGLLAQTYPNIELIIIDDYSPDNSWKQIQQIAPQLRERFHRVELRQNNKNQGLLKTLQQLIPLAKGKYTAILESDDYYKPEKIATSVAYFEANPDIGLVHCEIDFSQGDTIQERHWEHLGRKIPIGNVYENLLQDNFVLTCGFSCRTEILQKHARLDEYIKRGYLTADYPIFLDLARHTRFGYIDQSLAVYRVVENSISHQQNPERHFKWNRAYYQIKLDYIAEFGASPEIISRANQQFYWHHYKFGWATFKPDAFKLGRDGLQQYAPQTISPMSHWVRALAMRSYQLWQLVRMFESRIQAS